MKNTVSATNKKFDVRQIAVCAVFTALTCVFTMFLQIPTGSAGGMVHIGNIPLFTAAALFGKKNRSCCGRRRNGFERFTYRLGAMGADNAYYRRYHGLCVRSYRKPSADAYQTYNRLRNGPDCKSGRLLSG